MQSEKDPTAEYQRETSDQKSDGHPAQTRQHHYQKAILVLAADEINTGQSAHRRKPIDSVKLHMQFLNAEPAENAEFLLAVLRVLRGLC